MRPADKLTETQRYVYSLLLVNREGMCRLDFAHADVWEVSNRIGEIEDRLGITIERERCRKHNHRHAVTLYRI